MTKLNPQNFSVEALDRVSEFYKQSFEQLLTLVGWVGVIAGFVAPAIIWFVNNKILTKDRKDLEDLLNKLKSENEEKIKKDREESRKLIKDLTTEYEKKLEQNLKQFKEDFEKEKSLLNKKIDISEAKSFLFQGVHSKDYYMKIIFNELSLYAALRSEEERMIFAVLDVLLADLKKSNKSSFGNTNFVENILKRLHKLKNGKPSFISIVSQIEEEFNAAKERE
jgi:hypothetical protein